MTPEHFARVAGPARADLFAFTVGDTIAGAHLELFARVAALIHVPHYTSPAAHTRLAVTELHALAIALAGDPTAPYPNPNMLEHIQVRRVPFLMADAQAQRVSLDITAIITPPRDRVWVDQEATS